MTEQHPDGCPCDDCHGACELCGKDTTRLRERFGRPVWLCIDCGPLDPPYRSPWDPTPPQDYVGYNLPERHRERT
jgi:hypothetical protein